MNIAMHILAVVAGAALCAAPVAAQQDLLRLGLAEGQVFAMADFQWSYDRDHPLSFDLGYYGYLENGISRHETYAALTLTFANGSKLAAGVPVAAYDSFAISALDQIFPTASVDRANTTRSEATSGAITGQYLPLGVRFDPAGFPVRMAVSAHHANSSNTSFLSFGAAAQIAPQVAVSGAVEVTRGGDRPAGVKVQVVNTGAWTTTGLGLSLPGYPGVPDFAELFTTALVAPHISLTGVARVPLDASTPLISVGGRYDLSNRASLTAGALHEGNNTQANAFAEFRF